MSAILFSDSVKCLSYTKQILHHGHQFHNCFRKSFDKIISTLQLGFLCLIAFLLERTLYQEHIIENADSRISYRVCILYMHVRLEYGYTETEKG